MMRQQMQPDDDDGGDDEGIRICVLLHRNVKVVFDLLGTGGNYSVPMASTLKEMKNVFLAWLKHPSEMVTTYAWLLQTAIEMCPGLQGSCEMKTFS